MLPAGAACSFQPQPAVLDGFSTAAVALTITESTSHASLRVTPDLRRVTQMPSGPLAAIAAASLILLTLRREKRVTQACVRAVLLYVLSLTLGCGSSSSSTRTQVTPPPALPDPTIVTITAAGASGSTAVSHSVQIAVTFK